MAKCQPAAFLNGTAAGLTSGTGKSLNTTPQTIDSERESGLDPLSLP
jgi:hypothetical protein